MKKYIIVLLTFVCILCAGCSGKGNKGDQADIPYPDSKYSYSYKETGNDAFEFVIEGKWGDDAAWKVNMQEGASIKVQEEQTAKKAEYNLTFLDKQEGYEQVEFGLYEKESGKNLYTFTVLVTVMENKLSVTDVFYSEPMIELEENSTTDEEEAEKENAEEFSVELTLPEELEVREIEQTYWPGREDKTIIKEAFFKYKDNSYRCEVLEKVPLSEYQKYVGVSEADAVVDVVNGVETYTFSHGEYTCTMWKGSGEQRYFLFAEGIEKESVLEVVALFLK